VGETPSFVLSDRNWNRVAMARELSAFYMPCQSQSRRFLRLSDELGRHSTPRASHAETGRN
ncbi:MAG: hypothetical protein ACXWIO_06885, partial [Croceibacterium sp.]